MNDLLKTMSRDMGILQYSGEEDAHYIYRLCYSALGQWCLNIANNKKGGIVGTTKNNQTLVLNDLLQKLYELFPCIASMFSEDNNKQLSFPVSIRRIYEETGYLLNGEENYNIVANFGRTINFGEKILFFGLPKVTTEINGLGVFSSPTDYVISLSDFMIRDNLTSEQYFRAKFDSIYFCDRDIDWNDLEFFDPKSNSAPSRSWKKNPRTDCTIARKTETGPFYRMMKIDGKFQFAEELVEQQTDRFISYEYRRLYFALKKHYGKPLKAYIAALDKNFSRLRLEGHLPNREYYLLLLLSWPENNAFNRLSYIIRNDILFTVILALQKIGLEIKEDNQ